MTLFINKDGKRLGPYSIEQIKAEVSCQRILLSDSAWTEGESDWKPLSQFPAIVDAVLPPISSQPVAPPIIPTTPTSAPASIVQGPVEDSVHASEVRKSKIYRTIATVLICLFFGPIVIAIVCLKVTDHGSALERNFSPTERDEAIARKASWHTNDLQRHNPSISQEDLERAYNQELERLHRVFQH